MSRLKSLGARRLTFSEPGKYSLVDQQPFVIELSIVFQISCRQHQIIVINDCQKIVEIEGVLTIKPE